MYYKDKVRLLLEDGDISPVEMAEAINDYVQGTKTCNVSGVDILDALNGWTVDDEMAINWGVRRLMERLGNDKGFIIAFEVLSMAREKYLKEQREKFKAEVDAIEEEKESPDVCQFKCGWCHTIEGCKGTREEWDEGITAKGETCYMQVDQESYQCPQCNKGIINPTFNGTVACDKCAFEVNYDYFKANQDTIYNKEAN